MKKMLMLCAAALVATGFGVTSTSIAQAATVLAGTASNGTVALTAPPNGSWTRALIDSPNVPGEGSAIFNFDPHLLGAPGYGGSHPFQVIADQFRFEMDFDRTGTSPHTFHPVDYNGTTGGVEDTSENVVWAITGNNGARTNSILRGSSMTFNYVTGATTFSGTLQTDGLIHWYYGTNTTTLASLGAENYLVFSGTVGGPSFSPNYATCPISLSVSFVAVPVPATLPAGLALLGLCGVGLLIRRRRRAA